MTELADKKEPGNPALAHEHVTLDEEVFHAYQEIWLAATYLPSPDASMRMALAHLADALAESARNCATEPRHHEGLAGKAVEQVRALHRPWGIYGDCGHENHAETEWVADTGYALVCAEGKLYDVCRECHMDGGEAESEPEWVADSDDARWPCPTIRILDPAPSSGASSVSSVDAPLGPLGLDPAATGNKGRTT